MPSTPEIIGIIVVLLVVWFLLKLARVAVKLIFVFITLILIVGAVYFLFVR